MKVSATVGVALILTMISHALGRSLLAGPPSPTLSDVDILNLALNLEYLEAEFYSCAAYGTPLPADVRGGGPASTGCQKATLSAAGQDLAAEIARNEIAHVSFLRQALGAAAVAIPAINIGTAFSEAADAATNQTLSPSFTPYDNDIDFFLGSFLFEDVGVTAYAGAAALISNKSYLTSAADILAVEAYHAGTIRTALYFNQNSPTTWPGISAAQFAQMFSNLRNNADGPANDDQGILASATNANNSNTVAVNSDTVEANIVPADANALVFDRTPAQVIDIVTLGMGPAGGGFLPAGLNGFFAANGVGNTGG